MGFFNRKSNNKNTLQELKVVSDKEQGVVPFADFTLVLKTYLVDSIFRIGLPIEWIPYESDRFRAKTKDEKTEISITNWKSNDNQVIGEEQLRASVLPLYEKFVAEGGYEPYDDLVINSQYISKSFRVDEEVQYYLTTFNKIGDKVFRTGFIIRDIGEYNPKMRATLLNLVSTMSFV